MSLTSQNFKDIAVSAAQLADQKLAEDILLLDLRKAHTGITDYMVIVSANSQTHLNALRDHIEDSLNDIGLQPAHKEGRKDNAWQILDYGGVLVHLFHQGIRNNYSIERLWEQARVMEWSKRANGRGNGHARRFPAPSRKVRKLSRAGTRGRDR